MNLSSGHNVQCHQQIYVASRLRHPCNSLKEVLLSLAEKVLGKQGKKIQSWVTNMVLDLCDQRQQLKQRAVRKNIKAAKEEWVEDIDINANDIYLMGFSKMNFKNSPTDSWTEQGLMEWKSVQKRARS